MMDSRESPLVSVIVPVYNAGEYLRPSIASIVEQTYENIEIIIVDDGSNDDCISTIADISDSRMQVFRQENAGKPVAMNFALSKLSGEFYAIQDADDVSHPHRIERQVQCMVENPSVAGVFCGNDLLRGERRVAPTFRRLGISECHRRIARCIMPGLDPTAMFRVSMVRGMEYDPALGVVEGFDYTLRVGEKHPLMAVGECLYSYRLHTSSVTKTNVVMRRKLSLSVVRRACTRRGLPILKEWSETEEEIEGQKSRNQDLDNNIASHYMNSADDLRTAGRRWEALQTAWECARMHPLDPHYLKALVYALAPGFLVKRLRRR
jgi:glycosyltransferase involved in cell wall biosynthesis